MKNRCSWCGDDPLYLQYHDTEWGVPVRDSRALFEALILEGFQAGLSWITILRKRPAFREAFAGFDPVHLATWDPADVERLLGNDGIVRHRGKIEATLNNACRWQEIEAKEGFSAFLWSYVDGTPLQPGRTHEGDVPGSTKLSTQISKDLKRAGFKFCGPTTVYAFMQAAGLVNDHSVSCFRHAQLGGAS